MKRFRIERLSKELTEVEYLKEVYSIAKEAKKEMDERDTDETAKQQCKTRREAIEAILLKKWKELDPQPELTVDELAKLFDTLREKKELPDEWIPLPPTWKWKYWGTCCFRGIGGSCDQDVKHVCALVPFRCTGGSNMDSGKQDAICMYHNEYNENFVCQRDYSRRYRLPLYKRFFFPSLIEQWNKNKK